MIINGEMSEERNNPQRREFLAEAVRLSVESVRTGGGPFGAVIVKGGEIVASGVNRVAPDNDPTAHAEVVAIRSACRSLSTFNLAGCEIYASCEPCPMCLSAIYWARLDSVWFAADRVDAMKAGFDDDRIYREIELPMEARSIPCHQIKLDDDLHSFELWARLSGKVEY